MRNGKYQIACTTWHVMHYWDLFNVLKEHADFYLIDNTARSWRDPRFLAARPIPENANFVPFYESGKYDFALLNVDQQCLNPEMGKHKIYSELNRAIQDIPKVVINHGSPVWPEYFKHEDMTDEDAKVVCRQAMVDLIGKNKMIVNSYYAAKDWGFGHPIWHGLDANEWISDMPKEPRVVTALSAGGLDMYYNRSCMSDLLHEVEQGSGYVVQWARISVNAKTDTSPDAYKKFLGKALIYVDTSFETPMNRARTEAMLSGCCIVQVKGAHDLERFAVDGENIVLVPNNPTQIAAKIAWLLKHPDIAKKIGMAGRETAIKLFNRARYRDDWLKFIKEEVLL